MSRKVVVHDEAESELAAAVLWYDARRRGLGNALLDAVAHTLDTVANGFDGSPYLASGDVTARRVPVDRFPYALVFVVEEATVHVLAFAHSRRLPGYWRTRR